jgi:hypothetical protein
LRSESRSVRAWVSQSEPRWRTGRSLRAVQRSSTSVSAVRPRRRAPLMGSGRVCYWIG